MPPEPIYIPEDVTPAYQLRFNWTGWLTESRPRPCLGQKTFEELTGRWERDGIRILEQDWADNRASLLASVKPRVSPTFFAARIKGRLQHAFRQQNEPVTFRRKFSVRTVGEARRSTIEAYVGQQVENESLADPKFADFLEQFTIVNDAVDLSQPISTDSGRYWYNLHLVLVIRDRVRLVDESWLGKIRDLCLRIAAKKGHRISALSVMPDHLHLVLGGSVEQAPCEVALSYMNNIAYALGQDALWETSFYVGSFGEYSMNAIRRACRSDSPAGQARRGLREG